MWWRPAYAVRLQKCIGSSESWCSSQTLPDLRVRYGEDGRDHTIVVVLEDTLTPAERNMATMGEHQRLRDMRMVFQYATVREFCDPVERLTGRKVRAFVSAIDTEVDGLSIETFVLHPAGYDGPSRPETAGPRR